MKSGKKGPEVKFVEDFVVKKFSGRSKITEHNQAFVSFLENWDTDVMAWVKEYKALVLTEGNGLIFEVSFESFNDLEVDKIKRLFALVKDLPKASKVIIGQNNPEKSVLPDREEKELAAQFKFYGESANLPVVDQLILSSNSVYAFDQDDLRKNYAMHP